MLAEIVKEYGRCVVTVIVFSTIYAAYTMVSSEQVATIAYDLAPITEAHAAQLFTDLMSMIG